jgi:hypothetical protein
MAWFRLALTAPGDTLHGIGTVGLRRSRLDPDLDKRGSADPEKPDAYDMWPSTFVPISRSSDPRPAQATELVIRDTKPAGVEFTNGGQPGVRMKAAPEE